ncbi:DUF2499 domain-containing protein [Prochlorococcus sp. MIT 1223]|uniref:DUF2499 domain-containing protein n=1 Tax=Prochlorococcus sp. MIT 1223 TaxID=3096217 RepID=UPI002A75D717|nr:DUF2499 domain-containing protein [Prochlorococcus sp. MIT 1223]
MHSLSLPTWFIHIATVLEWTLAIILISIISFINKNRPLNWLALSMLPNLASAMAAVTWHIFDNTIELKGLVVIQAALTVIGNSAMALAAYNLYKKETISL